MKIAPINHGNFDRRAIQFLSRSQSAESAPKNDDAVLFPHRLSPENNLIQATIISSIANCPALVGGTCAAIAVFSDGRPLRQWNWNEKRVGKNLRMYRKETNTGFQLEKNTLRFLCSVLIKSGTRVEICNLLDPAIFEDPLQRVVFEEIQGVGPLTSRR